MSSGPIRWVRTTLARVPLVGGGIGFASTLKDALLDGSARRREQHERLYAATMDPYGATTDDERPRLRAALAMLERIPQRPIGSTFEVGCGEGHFSVMLAPLCRSLIAVDSSPTAVARATSRLGSSRNVEVRQWDLYTDAVPHLFDLIVVMTVLEYVHRPSHLRAIRDRLVAGLTPGGYLLVGTTASSIDNTWYGRRFARGRWLNDVVAEHPQLMIVAREGGEATQAFEHVLFRSRQVSQ